MKKIIASTVICALLLGGLAGCGGSAGGNAAENTQQPAAEAEPETPSESLAPAVVEGLDGMTATGDEDTVMTLSEDAPDFDLAYSKYAPDTPVMSVNGEEFTWSTYFDVLRQNVDSIYINYGISDLSLDMGDGQNMGDLMRSSTESRLKQLGLFYSKAAEKGVTLDAEDEAAIDAELERRLAYYDNDKEYMFSSMGVSEEFYRAQAGEARLYDKLLTQQFGEKGSLISDEDVLAYVEDNDILYAKHILFSTTDPYMREKLDDASIAKAKAAADETLAELQAASPEELPALFDTLMHERSEDGGLASRPDGYFFQEGDMVDAFYQAALALQEGEISGIVESEYGYHILYRPVLTPDATYSLDINGEPNTLRSYVASMLFNNIVNDWFDEAEIRYFGDFETLDVAALFAK